MANVIQFTSNLGTVDFDFDNRKVLFGRFGSSCRAFHLVSMEISFADITEIEVRSPKFPVAPAFCFIVKGKRLMTDNNCNATQFVLNKADYQKALSALEQVITICGISGIKDYERAGIPKKEYVPSKKQVSNNWPWLLEAHTRYGKWCETRRITWRNSGLATMLISIYTVLSVCFGNATPFLGVVGAFGFFVGLIMFGSHLKPQPIRVREPKDTSGTKEIVKGAVIGGIVAGEAGAIVGATIAKNKLDK